MRYSVLYTYINPPPLMVTAIDKRRHVASDDDAAAAAGQAYGTYASTKSRYAAVQKIDAHQTDDALFSACGNRL